MQKKKVSFMRPKVKVSLLHSIFYHLSQLRRSSILKLKAFGEKRIKYQWVQNFICANSANKHLRNEDVDIYLIWMRDWCLQDIMQCKYSLDQTEVLQCEQRTFFFQCRYLKTIGIRYLDFFKSFDSKLTRI